MSDAINEAREIIAAIARRLAAHENVDVPANTFYDLGRAIGWLEIAIEEQSSHTPRKEP